jgi:RNase P subunit RPR2
VDEKGLNRVIEMSESNTDKITMWTCSCCGKDITHYDEVEKEVYADTHFDVERSHKELFIEDDNIEENLQHRNEKMNRTVCESCFNKILSESPTLRKTFEVKNEGKIQILF